MKRLRNLDYLRGLSASGIMVFHFLTWTYGKFTADTVISKIGVYGVSIFYILSGLTLYTVYHEKMNFSIDGLKKFFVKRIFRIFPLLWIATIFPLFLYLQAPDLQKLLLTLTGLFGFLKWDTYYGIVTWSIGNELVFYSLFPLFLYLSKKHYYYLIVVVLILFSIYCFFAFSALDPSYPLKEQWKHYVNPLNQLFLFLSGFMISFVFKKIKISPVINIMAIVTGALIFILYPVANGDVISLITGTNRLVFTLACMLICLGFYKLSITLPSLLDKPLCILGYSSYSIYLLHPIIFKIIQKLSNDIFDLEKVLMLTASISTTLVVSNFSYIYLEKHFIEIGNKKAKINL